MIFNITVDTTEVKRELDRITTTIPKEQDNMGREIATRIKKVARTIEKMKRTGRSTVGMKYSQRMAKGTKNLLYRGMDISRLQKGRINQWIFLSIAPYTYVQEMGAPGWRFIPRPGRGVWGEGFAAPGGVIPSRYPHGKRFIEGGYNSAIRALPIITDKYARRMVR